MDNEARNVITGVTGSGFEFSVDVRAISDIRTVRKIGKMFEAGQNEQQQICHALDAYELILGADQVIALEEHIRKMNDGYCTAEDFESEVTEIIRTVNPVKN
ncbi:MAG: hypothetical protein MJ116_02910 [Lachnospiraceae bacterium]|nr:hypothetical protein [Lachnospiraceae bacterium]